MLFDPQNIMLGWDSVLLCCDVIVYNTVAVIFGDKETKGIRMPGRRPKEDKPPPPTGPGSRVEALPDVIRRHVIPITSGLHGFELRFSTSSVRSLPAEICENEELMNSTYLLDAPNNRLKRLPQTIGDLECLESIDVSNNAISSLPASLADLQSLSYLDVSNNSLRSLPSGLGRAPALTDVRASNNRIRSVPMKLPSVLETIDLSQNDITKLNKSIYRIPMRLNVSHNKLASLPPPVGVQGPTIHDIDASHNRITSLPSGMGNLGCLTSLNLSDNRLAELPAAVARLRYLRLLDVSRNCLSTLPEDICLLDWSLEELRVAGNQLRQLPAEFGRFRRLSLLV